MTEGKEGLDAKVRKGKDKRIVGCYKHKAEKATKQELHSKVLQTLIQGWNDLIWASVRLAERLNETKVG